MLLSQAERAVALWCPITTYPMMRASMTPSGTWMVCVQTCKVILCPAAVARARAMCPSLWRRLHAVLGPAPRQLEYPQDMMGDYLHPLVLQMLSHDTKPCSIKPGRACSVLSLACADPHVVVKATLHADEAMSDLAPGAQASPRFVHTPASRVWPD